MMTQLCPKCGEDMVVNPYGEEHTIYLACQCGYSLAREVKPKVTEEEKSEIPIGPQERFELVITSEGGVLVNRALIPNCVAIELKWELGQIPAPLFTILSAAVNVKED